MLEWILPQGAWKGRTLAALKLGELPCCVLVRVTLALTLGMKPGGDGSFLWAWGPRSHGPSPTILRASGPLQACTHRYPVRAQLLPGPTPGPV